MDETTIKEDWTELMDDLRLACEEGDIQVDGLLKRAARDSKLFIILEPTLAALHLRDLYDTTTLDKYDIGVDALTRAWVDIVQDAAEKGNDTIMTLLKWGDEDPQKILIALAEGWKRLVLSEGFFGPACKEDGLRTEWLALYAFGELFILVRDAGCFVELRNSLLQTAGEILTHLWERRDNLLTDGIFAPDEMLRDMFVMTLLGYYFTQYCTDLSPTEVASPIKRLATRLAIFCWYHLPPGQIHGILMVAFLHLEHDPSFALNKHGVIKDVILDQFGAEAVLGRIGRDLKDGSASKCGLAPLLRFLEVICLHPDTRRPFLALTTYNDVMDVLKREEKLELGRDRTSDVRSSSFGCRILLWSMEQSPSKCVDALIRNGLVRFISHAVELCVQDSCIQSDIYSRLIYNLTVCVVVSNEVYSQAPRRDKTFYILRTDARQVWFPTLQTFRTLSVAPAHEESRAYLVEKWMEFGKEAGLEDRSDWDEEKMRAWLKNAMARCAWAACEFNVMKPAGALRTCAGCKETRYCDKVCQLRCVSVFLHCTSWLIRELALGRDRQASKNVCWFAPILP
ncbi:hypothetical protein OF83DRAFT_1151719 [Amylostereum chailletii]|nr:hypothetical protein OF83DRAFT_1151719 [Amylostereum chailletii]